MTPARASDVVEHADITYRQLDNWVVRGWVISSNGKHTGHGRARQFTDYEAEVTKRLRRFSLAGFNTTVAARLARESMSQRELQLLHHSPPEIIVRHTWERAPG